MRLVGLVFLAVIAVAVSVIARGDRYDEVPFKAPPGFRP